MQEIEAPDGTVPVKIQGGERSGEVIQMDVSILRDYIESCEADFPNRKLSDAEIEKLNEKMSEGSQYEVGKAYYVASPEFKIALAEQLARTYGYCTPSIAGALWLRYGEIAEALKKSTATEPASTSSTEEETQAA